MLQGQIALRKTKLGLAFIEPTLFVVSALLFVPAGEKSSRSFVGVPKIFAQNARCVGEMNHIIAEEKIVLDDVPNESADKCDVAPGADRYPDVSQRARARESRIDMNDGRATLDNEENYLIRKLFTLGLGMVCISNQARI